MIMIPLQMPKIEDLSFLEDSISSSASQESPIPESRDEKVKAVFSVARFAKEYALFWAINFSTIIEFIYF